ncbi:MAG: flagellar hook-length control protein FliK [Desulfobacterales bacterium]|nr:flagellar hook-length control protein FliK [Desulfobacterales bacterium]
MPFISQILLSSSDILIENNRGKKSELSGLIKNQLMDARVLKTLSNRQALLQIQGKRILVKTHIPLKAGEQLQLQVKETGEQQVLRVVASKGQEIRQLYINSLKSLGKGGPYESLSKLLSSDGLSQKSSNTIQTNQIFLKLDDVLRGMSLKSDNADINLFRSVIKDSGLVWESKVSSAINNAQTSSGSKPHPITDKDMGNLMAKLLGAENFIKPLKQQISAGVAQSDKATLSSKASVKLEVVLKGALQNLNQTDLNNFKSLAGAKDKGLADKLLSFVKSEQSGTDFQVGETSGRDIKTLLLRILESDDGTKPLKQTLLSDLFQSEKSEKNIQTIRSLENALKIVLLNTGKADKNMLKAFIQGSNAGTESKKSSFGNSQETFSHVQVNDLTERDIKGLMLRLLESGDLGKTVKQQVSHIVDNLEKLQVLNRFASDALGRYLLMIPFLFDEQVKFGQMLIDCGKDSDKEGKSGKKPIKVSVLLEMSSLGDIRVDLSMFDSMVFGAFGVTDNDTRIYVEENIPTLVESLERHGFTVSGITCQVVRPELLENATLFDQLVDAEAGRLSLLV